MSDVSITVTDNPVQITATSTDNQVSVATAGIQGSQGTAGLAGGGIDTTPLISGLSGQLNISGFNLFNSITGISSNLSLTGTNLNNLINGLSGQLNLSGANLRSSIETSGTNLITFISSNSATVSNLALTGSNLDNKINYVSGALNSSGAILKTLVETSGTAVISYSTTTFGTKTNLENSGTSLQSQINTVTTNLTTSGTNLNNLINGLSGQLNISGGNLRTAIENSGTNLITYTNNNFGTISNLTTTGTTLRNLIIGLSGQLDASGVTLNNKINTESNKPTITGVSISGGNSLTGFLSIIQGANITLSQIGDTGFSIAASGSTIINAITGLGINNYLARFTSDNSGIVKSNIADNGAGAFVFSGGAFPTNLTASFGNMTCGGEFRGAGMRSMGTFYLGGVSDLILDRGAPNLLTIGGTTASFPGMKPSGTNLAFMLANNSAGTSIICNGVSSISNLNLSSNDNTATGIVLSGQFIGINNNNPISTLDISGSLAIRPVLISGASVTLGSNSFYIHTGNQIDTFILPTAASAPGRFYFIKNIGMNLTLTGNSKTETLFTTQQVLNFTINSGESYISASDGVSQWLIM